MSYPQYVSEDTKVAAAQLVEKLDDALSLVEDYQPVLYGAIKQARELAVRVNQELNY